MPPIAAASGHTQWWLTADIAEKLQLLEIICLNSTLDGVKIVPEMRKPSICSSKVFLSRRVGATGFEPAKDPDATGKLPFDSRICSQCRAANCAGSRELQLSQDGIACALICNE